MVKPTTKVVSNRSSDRTTRQKGKGKGRSKATPKSADPTPSTGGDDNEEIEESSVSNTNIDDESGDPPPKVSAILASKKLSPAEWKEMCKAMNTSQVREVCSTGYYKRRGKRGLLNQYPYKNNVCKRSDSNPVVSLRRPGVRGFQLAQSCMCAS